MRKLRKLCTLSALGATVALVAGPATAQNDVEPPRPNVLLLVDTSGSMEYLADGTEVEHCDPVAAGSDSNRWTTLVEVLTGTVSNRRCSALSRSSTAFNDEFSIGSNKPYDYGYKLPYHRIVSNGCVVGPGTSPANVYDWPTGAIAYRHYSTKAACTGWDQARNGLLDVFRDRVRFGLMTFDSHANAGIGVVGSNPGTADAVSGFAGLWSYYGGWQGSTAGRAQGNPVGCTLADYEVGARNAAAPPWEGRLIAMGRPAAPLTGAGGIREINDHIQEALLAIRPYGATPLAGMFEDARTFFRTDVSKDPLYPTEPFAPAGDPYFGGGCRKTYIIVLSDGEPNLDLRPYCETQTPAPAGKCPFAQPWEIAHDLANPGNPTTQPAVRTFAVGFGLSVPHDADGHDVDCSTIVATDFDTAGRCVGATGSLRACCTLARIALEGDTTKAYFADTPLSLQTALSDVLSQIAAGSTSRTMPSFASGTAANSSSDAPAKAYQFVSSFEPMTEQILWEGNLERKRWVCKTQGTGLVATLDFVPSAGPGIYVGDDFAYNLNNGQIGHPRTFLTVVGGASADSTVYSTHTIRPKLPLSDPDPLDGLSTYRGTTVSGDRAAVAAEMGAHSTAMGIPVAATAADMLAECKDAELAATSSADCATRVMNWELGGTNTGVTATRAGHELGAIYHSTPALHGRPDEFLRDESYSLFAHEVETRPLMLYTATTDGQLHAFKVASNGTDGTNVLVDGPENNELWSFLPPYVLPGLLKQYPRTQQILLDGEPVVKDVILERTAAQAQAGSETGAAKWRTVLVAGGGQAGGFYYALDVTEPTAAAVTDSTKPFFLWQLSTDEPADATDLPQPLFGSSSAVPAVATIAYRKSSSDAIKEIAVAILPGGEGKADGTDACPRHLGIASTTYGHISPYPPRTSTRCWLEGPARSLTIVRLSDGKVLKTFRGHDHDGPATIDALVELVDFDAPITGTPVPYPSRSGQVSDRIYVGDADGTLWRVNLASPDPALWDVHIAFDAYPLSSDADSNTQHFGQPVDIPPVVSVDGIGNTIVLFATGDQNDLTTATTGMKTRLWSLTETPATPATAGAPPFKIKPNWALQFAGGKRVTGPIALFDTVAYFSTFAPSGGADACVDGNGAIWGVDYLKSTAVTGQPNVPVPRLPTGTGDVSEKVEAAGVVVFGVAVSQQPSCYTPDDTVQDWYGTHTRITKSTVPVYQLVYQTGAGGTASGGVKTNTKSQVLPPLRELTRIDSWASIVE